MTMFGLKEAEVATLVRAVAGEALDRDGLRDRFARGTWTGIAEPGDGIAGAVIVALGAAEALEGVVGEMVGRAISAPPSPRPALIGSRKPNSHRRSSDGSPGSSRMPHSSSFRQAVRYGTRLLTPDLEDWPDGLADLGAHAPLALWMRGTDAALAALANSIAIVGARAASGYGEHVTMEAAAGLVDRGFAIVSGAAYVLYMTSCCCAAKTFRS